MHTCDNVDRWHTEDGIAPHLCYHVILGFSFFLLNERKLFPGLLHGPDHRMVEEHHPALGWGFAAWATCVHGAFFRIQY